MIEAIDRDVLIVKEGDTTWHRLKTLMRDFLNHTVDEIDKNPISGPRATAENPDEDPEKDRTLHSYGV